MSALIVLVNSDPRTLRHLEGRLSECGYLVAPAASFLEARRLLTSTTPDLLVVGMRLGAYNGLHLAIRTRLDHPDVPVILTHSGPDPIAEAEARRHGAAFIPTALDNPEFLPEVKAAIARRQQSQRPLRRWTRRPVSQPVQAGVGDASAQILDVSYGGVCLSFSEPCEIPAIFDVFVPAAGLTMHAQRVWTSGSPQESVVCGAVLLDAPADHWHRFVDVLVDRDAAG
jgi:DNA-binding response OmpR family regulator